MRARNIKPDFFRDAELAEVTVETRYLFIGLWCLADREGKLKDHPKQIRFEVFPETKTKDDIEIMLKALVERDLIIRYAVDNKRYIKVTNFLKHQSPHTTEKKSEIPEPNVSSRETTLSNVDIPLNPDCGILNPESVLKASSPPAPPYQKIIDLWNAHAPELLPRASLTETRKPKIKTAWKEHPDLEWWKVLFADISLSSWHSHRDKWRGCSFDWILKKRTEMREKLDAIKKSNGGAHHPPGKAVNLPEDPPGILVFDPSCPVCHGDGFKTMGKCKCARTREEIHANQKATTPAQ